MRATKIIGFSLIAATCAAGVFLYRYFARQALLLKDYAIEPLSLKVIGIQGELVTMQVGMRIFNKSAIEATVQKLYADLHVEGALIGSINNDQQFVLPAKGSSDAFFNVTFAKKEILKNIVQTLVSLAKKQDIGYQAKGYVKVKSGGVSFQIPFNYDGLAKSDILG